MDGSIGSISGRIPQEYRTYIFEPESEYLIFTIYALDREAKVDRLDMTWPLDPQEVETFERIIGSLQLVE